MKTIHAVYENGVFRPTDAVDLPEGSRVRILPELPRTAEEVVLTEDHQPVVKLVGEQSPKPRLRPPPGLGKGMITIVSDDDEHLKDFAEYMP